MRRGIERIIPSRKPLSFPLPIHILSIMTALKAWSSRAGCLPPSNSLSLFEFHRNFGSHHLQTSNTHPKEERLDGVFLFGEGRGLM